VGDLSSHFRIFVKPGAKCHNPALRPTQLANIARTQTHVHTEGNHNIDEIGNISAGSGIWYNQDDARNTCLKIKTDINSDQLGELVAILWAITEEPPQNELTIITKSTYALDGILNKLKKWESTGYIGVQNRDIFRSIVAALRHRSGTTCFKKNTDNDGEAGHTAAKSLALQGATKEAFDEPNLNIHPNFNLTGAQLVSMTQSLAYKGICEMKLPRDRRGTTQMLAITRHAVKALTGNFPDDQQVWRSTRHQDFSKMFCTFLWKSLHNTHKIGNYWDNIENYSHRGLCTKCRVTENLEHILLECDIPGQRVVWKNVKELWLKKHENWPEPINIGTITGCGLIEVKSREGTVLKGESHAYRILISESAHLIWKLRCTRIYSDKPDDEWPENPEIQN